MSPFNLSRPIDIPAGLARPDLPHERSKSLRTTWGTFRRKPTGVLGLSLIAGFACLALAYPVLINTIWERSIYHPLVGFDYDMMPHPTLPSVKHLLGTDSMGRDVLSQLLYATNTSFGVGIVAGLISTILATLFGVISAHYGNAVDTVLSSISDAFILLPAPVILLVIGLLVQMGWLEVGIIFGTFSGLGAQALIAKAYAQSIKIKPYIDAARLSGGSGWYIIRVHYLPNMASLMLVNMMFTVTQSVLMEAVLSFYGRTTLRMSWGTMIWFTQVNFRLSPYGNQWHALLPPVLSIMLFCSAFYMVGRAMDDVINPRLRKL